MNSFDDNGQAKFRQRLWGAAVIIAVLVIALPLLLDGAGSESQFRRVKELRQEPPRIIDEQGNDITPEPVAPAESHVPDAAPNSPPVSPAIEPAPRETAQPEAPVPEYIKADEAVRELFSEPGNEPPTAWVVQAGSFRELVNAEAVRDQLRAADFPSFVRDRESTDELFRVLVGPMISEAVANTALVRVEKLLKREALVLSYP